MEPFILLIALIIYACVFLLGHKIGKENAESTKIIERLWLELDNVYPLVKCELEEREQKDIERLFFYLKHKGYWLAGDYYNQSKEDKLRVKALLNLTKETLDTVE